MTVMAVVKMAVNMLMDKLLRMDKVMALSMLRMMAIGADLRDSVLYGEGKGHGPPQPREPEHVLVVEGDPGGNGSLQALPLPPGGTPCPSLPTTSMQ